MYHAYNADGIRTAKLSCGILTSFLPDGGDVVAEAQNDVLYASYLRGVNLICRESNSAAEYYLFDAHADVIALTDETGAVTKSYEYDAFGCEASPDPLECNPFRYCGEYFDVETGSYYLRARYYAPTIGRFTQQDTHWTTANMIYGDNPQKINQRQDALGLSTYTMIPQITAVMQAGNLYVYGVNNPIRYCDSAGKVALELVGTGTANLWNPAGVVLLGVGAAIAVAEIAIAVVSYARYKSESGNFSIGYLGGSTPASPLPPNNNNKNDNNSSHMFGENGTQHNSHSTYLKNGGRIDSENPAPGVRPGQIHYQDPSGMKYYYNSQTKMFYCDPQMTVSAPSSVQSLLNNQEIINAIAKALQYLGETPW